MSTANLSYFGEETIRYRIVDHIETDTMKNSNNEYVPVEGKENRTQPTSNFPRTLNFGSDPTSSKYDGLGESKKSKEDRRVELIRRQFVDYLLSNRGNE